MPRPLVKNRKSKRPRSARDDAHGPLTPAQWAFVEAYLGQARGNAVDAARIAGMGKTYNAWNNNSKYCLSLAKVQFQLKQSLGLHGLSAEMTVHSIAQMVQSSIADFLKYKRDGALDLDELGRPQFDLERARQLGKLHLIEELIIEPDGRVRIKLPKRTEALALLAKFHGLLADRLQVEVKGDEDIVRAEVLAKLKEAALGMDEADRRILAGLPAPQAPNNKEDARRVGPDGEHAGSGHAGPAHAQDASPAHAHAGPRQGGRGPATQRGGQGKVIEV